MSKFSCFRRLTGASPNSRKVLPGFQCQRTFFESEGFSVPCLHEWASDFGWGFWLVHPFVSKHGRFKSLVRAISITILPLDVTQPFSIELQMLCRISAHARGWISCLRKFETFLQNFWSLGKSCIFILIALKYQHSRNSSVYA